MRRIQLLAATPALALPLAGLEAGQNKGKQQQAKQAQQEKAGQKSDTSVQKQEKTQDAKPAKKQEKKTNSAALIREGGGFAKITPRGRAVW